MSLGATTLYVFANFFLKDLIKNKFLNKYENLENKFKKAEFMYLLVYRFIGGIPFAISNVLPCIFNVRKLNFFLGDFFRNNTSAFFNMFDRQWIRANN